MSFCDNRIHAFGAAMVGGAYALVSIVVGATSSSQPLLVESQKIITACCNNLTNPLTEQCKAALSQYRFTEYPDLMEMDGICVNQIENVLRLQSVISSAVSSATAFGVLGAAILLPLAAWGIHTCRSSRASPELK